MIFAGWIPPPTSTLVGKLPFILFGGLLGAMGRDLTASICVHVPECFIGRAVHGDPSNKTRVRTDSVLGVVGAHRSFIICRPLMAPQYA